MSDLKLPYTGEKLLELLGNIKTEEELRAFIKQYSSGGGHTDEEIRIIVAEWYQQNNTQPTKADVDGWIEEYLAENPVSGGTSIDDSVTSADKTWSSQKIIEYINSVMNNSGATVVTGAIDENNVITIYGLEAGTYNLYYEDANGNKLYGYKCLAGTDEDVSLEV